MLQDTGIEKKKNKKYLLNTYTHTHTHIPPTAKEGVCSWSLKLPSSIIHSFAFNKYLLCLWFFAWWGDLNLHSKSLGH